MAGRLRFPTSPPRTLQEQFERDRELVQQLERKVLASVAIHITETIVAHGLGETPGVVNWEPHCIAVIRETRPRDAKYLYLRATNECVADVEVARAFPDAPRVQNGGYKLPDWDPSGDAKGDHKVNVDATDTPEYLDPKVLVLPGLTKTIVENGVGRSLLLGVTPSSVATEPGQPVTGTTLFTAFVPSSSLKSAKAILAPTPRWLDCDATLIGYNGCGGIFYVFASFTQQPDGITWVRESSGVLPSSYIDDVTPTLNMRLFVGATGLAVTELPHAGIYELIDTGETVDGVAHYATIRRVADADASADFTSGKPVHVKNGTAWGGHTYRYSGAENPALDTNVPITFYDAGTSSIYASGFFGFGSRWVAQPGVSTWHQLTEGMSPGTIYPGPIYGVALEGSGTVSLGKGDRFVVWVEMDWYTESAFFGLYEIASCDANGANPVIRRCADANTAAALSSLVVDITGTGVAHGGDYFQQTLEIVSVDVDHTGWNVASSNPTPGQTRLLTANQISTAGASREVLTAQTEIPGNSGGEYPGAVLGPNTFLTLPGVPAAAKLPKGLQTLNIGRARLVDWDSTGNPGDTTVSFKIFNATGPELIFEAKCAIRLTSEWQTLNWQHNLADDFALSPTDTLNLEAYGYTTCTGNVTIEWEYNGAWNTWWQTTLQFVSMGGTNDHQSLLNRFKDVGNGDEPNHDADGIGPGFLHTPFATSTISAGLLPSPTRNDLLVSGSELKWIGTAKMSGGDTVVCTFVGSPIIRHLSSSAPANSAPLWLDEIDGDGEDLNWSTLVNCVAAFQLRTDADISPHPVWQLLWKKDGSPA